MTQPTDAKPDPGYRGWREEFEDLVSRTTETIHALLRDARPGTRHYLFYSECRPDEPIGRLFALPDRLPVPEGTELAEFKAIPSNYTKKELRAWIWACARPLPILRPGAEPPDWDPFEQKEPG